MVNLPPHKFHDKGTNGRLSPLKLYHMTNVPPEGIPYSKPSPGRNPIAGLPQGYYTIWQAFPPEEIPWQNSPLYGKSPPTQIPYVILGQHVRFVLGGGGGGTKSHRWGTFTTWYFIRWEGNPWGVPCDTGFALFWQHDVSPTKTSIPTNYNQP